MELINNVILNLTLELLACVIRQLMDYLLYQGEQKLYADDILCLIVIYQSSLPKCMNII